MISDNPAVDIIKDMQKEAEVFNQTQAPTTSYSNCGYCPHCGKPFGQWYPYQPWDLTYPVPVYPNGPFWYNVNLPFNTIAK